MAFTQAGISVQDEVKYAQVHAQLNAAFDLRDIEVLLSGARRAGIRVRDFEAVAGRGLLGREAAGLYQLLPVSDQALTRERYLQLVEAVAPELRQRYAKVYSSY